MMDSEKMYWHSSSALLKNYFSLFLKKDFLRIVLPSLLIFSIVHFNTDVLKSILSALSFDSSSSKKIIQYLIPFKTSIFFLLILYVSWSLKNEIYQFVRGIKPIDLVPPVVAFSLLQLAFWNFMPLSMGYGYAEMSLHPFDMHTGWYYKRLLMPALAYITGFRNIHLYFIFSCIISFTFMLMVWETIKKFIKGVSYSISLLIFFSVCSLEFISYFFFFPGYVDSLLSIFILLIYVFSFSDKSIIKLFVLALATHEVALILCLPIVLLRCSFYYRAIYATVVFIYCFLYLLSFGFDLNALLSVHEVSGITSFEWIKNNPLIFICGILASFKLMWISFFYGIRFSSLKQKHLLIAILLSCFFCCLLGIDTSRLMAFAFPVLLLSLPVVLKKMPQNIFMLLLIANMLLPHITVSLIMGIISVPYFKGFIGWYGIF